jgi:protein-disulfide isomerase
MYMFQAGGASGVTKDQVRQQMKQAAIEEARQRYFLTLRQTADVNIYLLPPALDVDYDPARVRGYPDAPITIVEFSDFQCPYCEQAYFMVKTLQERYAGKVKLAYRDLPLQEVQNEYHGAAVASRCAGEQDKFWEYHDILFEHQEEYGERYFVQFAETLGLDVDKFTACLNSDKYIPLVKADMDEAVRLGATGTPAFFINGIFVNGARPIEEFIQIIDSLLIAME